MSNELHQDVKEIKVELREVHEKLNVLIDKISEFEAVLDAADMIEESIEKAEEKDEESSDIWGSSAYEAGLEEDDGEY
jgi:uncharacterized coiled-coil DUF342 family protein